MRVADFKPALLTGMAADLEDYARIANDPAAPTFENTIAAMERTGRSLDRANRIYRIYLSTLNDESVQAVDSEMAPLLAAHYDQIVQNAKLFKRIAAVYAVREKSGLSAEQQRLCWLDYTSFIRAGAQLGAASKARLSELNQQLATLYTKFPQNPHRCRARANGRSHRPADSAKTSYTRWRAAD